MTEPRCKETTGDAWHRYPCRRSLKTPEQIEKRLCGPHLAGKKRREQHRQKFQEKNAANEARLDRAVQICNQLAGFGIEAKVHWHHTGYSDKEVLVNAASLALGGVERAENSRELPLASIGRCWMTREDLVVRLRKRAEIRRQIPTRKSVQNNEPDRIAELLEEAATEIERLRKMPLYAESQPDEEPSQPKFSEVRDQWILPAKSRE